MASTDHREPEQRDPERASWPEIVAMTGALGLIAMLIIMVLAAM